MKWSESLCSVQMSSTRGKDKPTNAAICVFYPAQDGRGTAALPLCQESGLVIFAHERGIPNKLESPTHVDQFPALCTHHSLLLPIRFSEALRLSTLEEGQT